MTTRALRLTAVIASLSLFAACGGGDDDDAADTVPEGAAAADDGDDAEAAPDTTTAATTAATTVEEAPAATTAPPADDDDDDDDDGDMIEVDDIGDLPEECRDTFAEFLRTIEPVVEGIDWENATMADFDTVTSSLETEMSGMEDEMDAACGDYDVTESADGIQVMIDFARDEAPGTVGYLEFLAGFIEDLGVTDGADPAADLPDDCAGLIGYVEGLIAEHSAMSELPMGDLMTISTAMGEISTKCTLDEANAFFARPEVAEFMSS